MKHLTLIVFLVLCTCHAIVSDAYATQDPQPETITIVTGENPPHTGQRLRHFGFINHVITESFSQVDIEVKYVFMPWSRAYLQAEKGDFIATSYWFLDDRHRESFILSEAISTEDIMLFRHKNTLSTPWQTWDDVKRLELKVGLTRGYTYNDDIWQYAEERPDLVSIVNSEQQNVGRLILNRIDVFPIEYVSGWHHLTRETTAEELANIDVAPIPLMQETSHLLFSMSHPDALHYLMRFNNGLKELRRSGKLGELRKAYQDGEYHKDRY